MRQSIKTVVKNKWVKRIALFLLLWMSIHIVYITADGLHHYNGSADVAIILGNKVYKNDSLSSWLRGRVDAALVLYQTGKVKKLFASGGISKDKNGYHPEGDAMKKYLLQHGVPDTAVVADNGGQNTFLTAQDFMAWNKTHHYTSAIVVSQFYHITRTKYILRKSGFPNVAGVSSVQYSLQDVVSTLREVLAFYKYVLWY